MNQIARESGYYVFWLLDKENEIIKITVGGGFTKNNKEVSFEVKHNNEIVTLYKTEDGVTKVVRRSDYSSRIRSGENTLPEILKELSQKLLNTLCEEYSINEKHVYYEEI